VNWYKQAQQQMSILFLDDDPDRIRAFRSRIPSAVITKTADEVIAQLLAENWDVVCLDHDLGGEMFVSSERDDTGAGVARWIADNKPSVGRFIVHSHNPDGAKNMESVLKGAEYEVQRIPFSTLISQI
jgi:hypothetical protein